jgi:hypothetical protein
MRQLNVSQNNMPKFSITEYRVLEVVKLYQEGCIEREIEEKTGYRSAHTLIARLRGMGADIPYRNGKKGKDWPKLIKQINAKK